MNRLTSDLDNIWSELVEAGLFTDDELRLVTALNGYTEETLNNALFVRTGFTSYDEYKEDVPFR